jgi:TonB family protein
VSAQDIYKPGNGVSLPAVVREVHPDYTQEAKAARIEGVVVLDTVVLADGAIGDVAVTRSLDNVLGLDPQAVKAMKQWVFKPGTKDGKAVAVRIAIQMKFALQ